jgi:hypothetical protein
MAFYPPEEIEKLRENVRRGMGKDRAPKASGKWQPDFSLHDKLGLPQPELLTAEELKALIQKNSSSLYLRNNQREKEIWLPYIEAEIKRVKDEVESRDEKPELVFSILGGSSASGKSTWRKRAAASVPRTNFSEDENIIMDNLLGMSVIVDPDDAKLMIPEYQAHLEAGIPGGGSFVHDESRIIAEYLRGMAEANQLPVTYDTSGQFNNGFQTLIDMRNSGYKNKAMYFLADPDVLIARAAEREKATGRGVPGYVIRNISSNLTSIIPSLWRSGYLDELTIVDTTNPNSPKVLIRLALDQDLKFEWDSVGLQSYFGQRNQWWTVAPQGANW